MTTDRTRPTDANLACIRCGRDFAEQHVESVPAGTMSRGQVFACAEHTPTVGAVVQYVAHMMAGISFDADGLTRTRPVVRSGKVQVVRSDHVLVGDDDAPEWVEVALADVPHSGDCC